VAGAHSSNFKGTIVPLEFLGRHTDDNQSRSLTRNVCPRPPARRETVFASNRTKLRRRAQFRPLRLLRPNKSAIAGFSPSAEK